MKQFLLTEPPDRDGLIRLRGEDYHYLVHVRRLKPGGAFTALLPPSSLDEGNSAPNPAAGSALDSARLVTITVTDIDGHTLTGAATPYPPPGREHKKGTLPQTAPPYTAQPHTAQTLPPHTETPPHTAQPPIILFQAMPKGPKMDSIVRQAAESGISEVVPFIAEYSIAKQHYRTERWERIIKEARQQSGSAVNTRIRRPLTSDQLFAHWSEIRSETTLGIVLSPEPDLKAANQPLAQGGFHHYLNKEPLVTVLAVGPEGGFSAGELERFLEAGFKPLSMGASVLRTDTAALYGAAAVRIILMEKEWWALKNQPKKQQ